MDGRRKMVYIASPYTLGNKTANVNYQIHMFSILLDLGFVPIAPLLCHFVNIESPKQYKTWIEYDLEVLKRCDVLLACRMGCKSKGRDMEISFAKENNIPVFITISELQNFCNQHVCE